MGATKPRVKPSGPCSFEGCDNPTVLQKAADYVTRGAR